MKPKSPFGGLDFVAFWFVWAGLGDAPQPMESKSPFGEVDFVAF